MNIGFDAKRAFLNQSGLGNYARTLIKSLLNFYPENNYSLFTTKKGENSFSNFISDHKNVSVIEPKNFIDKKLLARWRSYGITSLLNESILEIYHGLSNELPFNINKFKGKKIVTIHDLIFLRYPELYPFLDRKIYDKKFKSACDVADVIIAISKQTKRDIENYYSISSGKIKVIYQSCNDVFYKERKTENSQNVKTKYKLPENYLLYVGTIEDRKNLLTIVKALSLIKNIPLVVIGKKKSYFKKVAEFIAANKLEKRILFIENVLNYDLPAIYTDAEIFIYPSLFEGFGVPIIEALTCKVPVITTKGGCFSEAGGHNSIYVEPTNHEQLSSEIEKLLLSTELRKSISEKGFEYSKRFRPEIIAEKMMKLYSGK